MVTTESSILDLRDVSVNRGGTQVLHDINFNVERGEFVGIVGPNGSGKSTLLLTILGELMTRAGTVHLYGHPPATRKLYGKIGWVSQAASNLPKDIRLTVRELVRLGTVNATNMFSFFDSRRDKRVANAIRLVGLEAFGNTDVSRLSGGQRQRAVIARALASDAEFILLDEPLVGIDRNARNTLLKLLDQLCHDEGKTILMVSHDLAAIRQTAHRMIYLEETIRYDGDTAQFPGLEELAALRGIRPVHDHEHGHHHGDAHGHGVWPEEDE